MADMDLPDIEFYESLPISTTSMQQAIAEWFS